MTGTFKKLTLTMAAAAMLALPALPKAIGNHGNLPNQVRHELVMLPYYSIFDNLGYRVDGDAVTLSGQVTRPVLKSDAERVVKNIEGISRVVNQIEVLPLSDRKSTRLNSSHRCISYA